MTENIPLILEGKGTPLILLHGFMMNKESFASQISYFSKYFKVCAYDMCGFGQNSCMTYPYNLDDYVSEFLKVANMFSSKVNVIAHSFGARVVLKCASLYDIIDKMVICGGAGLKPRYSFKKSAKRCVYRLIRPLFKKEQLEKIFFSSDYNMLGDVMKESFKLVTSEHLDGLLNKIECPTMAIYGSDDDQTPIYMGRRLQSRMKNCKLFVMEGCNHFCYLQKPTLFNSVVKEFLL